MTDLDRRLIDNRYQIITELGKGGMGIVHKVYDRLSGQDVALKQVIPSERDATATPAEKRETSEIRLSIAHEFELLAGLRHPNIISVLDYGFDEDRQTYYTMQYLENAQHVDEAAKDKPLSYNLNMVRQMLEALRYLHQCDVIHHDVKPANALVVDDQLKLLDFGISMTTEQLKNREDTTIVGTLGYMAPEILTNQAAPSVASDLYSVGLIAYQLIHGKYPYQSNDVYSLIYQLANEELAFEELDASDDIQRFIKRLVQKNPHERYSSALEALKVLNAITGQDTAIIDTDVRDSLLQAARFVGRTSEFSRLINALNNTLLDKGSFWLIAGESGIGKSRLVEELRTQALVQGALVLRGQSFNEGGKVLGSWRPILRRLLLSTDVSHEEISVLRQIEPDILSLLEVTEEIPEAPELPPEASHQRLIDTVIRVLERQTQPLVLILEDLHWSNEGLEILKVVKNIVPERALMVIGTYRDDERKDIPKVLDTPDSAVIKLKPLLQPEIQMLVKAMLGTLNNQREITDWLKEETEGNIFFIIEALRVLLNDKKDISILETGDFPVNIMTSGMKEIITKRLDRVEEAYRPLLKQVAVLGRLLDLKVIEYIIEEQGYDIDLQKWLNAGLIAAVLSVQEEVWRFSHDKVRDGLIQTIEPENYLTLHRIAAEAIEAVYADDLSQHLSDLIRLWREAGDYEKVIAYADNAAQRARKAGLNQAAATFLTNSLNALEHLPQTDDTIREIIRKTLAYSKDSAFFAMQDKEARLLKALALAEQISDAEYIARVKGALGTTYYMSGNMGAAFGRLSETILEGERLELEDVLVLPYNIIGRAMAVNGNYTSSNDLLAKGIPLAEKYQQQDLLAGSLVYYGIGKEIIGQIDAGNPEIEQGIELSIATGQPERLASDHVILGMGYNVAMQFDKAFIHCTEAIEQANKINALQTLGIAYGGLTIVHTWLGNNERALETLTENDKIDALIGMKIHYVWYRACKAEILRRRGKHSEARKLAESLLEHALQMHQVLGLAETQVVMARIDMDTDQLDSAENYLQQALEGHGNNSCVALYHSAQLDLARLRILQGRKDDARKIMQTLEPEYKRLRMRRHVDLLKDFRNAHFSDTDK